MFGEDLEGLQKTVTISVKDFKEMDEKDKVKFVMAAIKEMESLTKRRTFTRLTRKQCHDRYWRNGIKTKNLPSKVVLTKKPDFETEEEWKPKVRVTACGNFEIEDMYVYI